MKQILKIESIPLPFICLEFGACDLDFYHPSNAYLIRLSFIEQTGRSRPEAPLTPETIR
jgi:hypothetical protein